MQEILKEKRYKLAREKKRFAFYAFDKTWFSIAECCRFYNVRYGSVFQYKKKHGCTTEEAIMYYRDLKKKGIFYYQSKK